MPTSGLAAARARSCYLARVNRGNRGSRVVAAFALLLVFAACPAAHRAEPRVTPAPHASGEVAAGGDTSEARTRALDAKAPFSFSDEDGGAPGVASLPLAPSTPPRQDAEPHDDDPARCALPFRTSAESCMGLFFRYGAVNGVCRPYIFGGCNGTPNRFRSMEECRRVCEARPATRPCPPGRVPQELCVSCGPQGACERREVVCAEPCRGRQQCESEAMTCSQGFCRFPGCE